MNEHKTSVTVSNDRWKRLILRKEPGDTFDDVIEEILDKVD